MPSAQPGHHHHRSTAGRRSPPPGTYPPLALVPCDRAPGPGASRPIEVDHARAPVLLPASGTPAPPRYARHAGTVARERWIDRPIRC
ncbi:hypothetical protein E2562_013772 [Oryza meyeriana var. granulata]|uniref:Uncharacterized protein n=1 Tax=Oryza meyeriana var. granulata TaxID=110450 RepID=A0A6G1F830_9ORYZ|nr:hypothetical protein E2562_013772 [Oryza meyeriana var. granulata]